MEEVHKPSYYVSGVWVEDFEEWRGDFHATSGELFMYAEHDVETVEEYELLVNMIYAQQVYMMWWDKMKNSMRG
jgi:hypothetical protein